MLSPDTNFHRLDHIIIHVLCGYSHKHHGWLDEPSSWPNLRMYNKFKERASASLIEAASKSNSHNNELCMLIKKCVHLDNPFKTLYASSAKHNLYDLKDSSSFWRVMYALIGYHETSRFYEFMNACRKQTGRARNDGTPIPPLQVFDMVLNDFIEPLIKIKYDGAINTGPPITFVASTNTSPTLKKDIWLAKTLKKARALINTHDITSS